MSVPELLPAAAWPLLLRAVPTLRHSARLLPPPTSRTHLLKAPDLAWLQRYRQYFPALPAVSRPSPAVPLCFYYLLLQRAQLATLLSCPGLRVAGLIHASNQLELCKPLTDSGLCQPTAQFVLQTQCQAAETDGRGWLDCRQQLYRDNELVLQGDSRYLLYKHPQSPRPATAAQHTRTPAGEPLQQWPLAANAGRRYAVLSGDWNPVHLWPWSARLFGQRQPILHGMAAAALLCAAMPAPVRQLSLTFLRPVRLGVPLQLFGGTEHHAALTQQTEHYQLWSCGQLAAKASLQLQSGDV